MTLRTHELCCLSANPTWQETRSTTNQDWQRIIAKAILYVICTDIQLATGALQTCAGHNAGAEAAIHAMRDIFADNNADAVLLVDASNAFNQVNRQCALHNIFATILT